MQLSANFTLSEFACNNGVAVPEHLIENVKVLATQLQILREELGVPIIINSGYRTADYNKSVGGKKNSFHLRAMAADIRTAHHTPKELAAIIERLIKEKKLWFGGVGVYATFVHVDIRKTKARW
jgi:uncharacterized protein YcbK (DUF882 family)